MGSLVACTKLVGLEDLQFSASTGGVGGTPGGTGLGGSAGSGGSGTGTASTGGAAGSGATAAGGHAGSGTGGSGTGGSGTGGSGTGGSGTGGVGTGGSGGGGTVSYADVVLADGPIAYWRLGETNGTIAYDVSGSDYHAVYSGGYTLGVAGLQSADADAAVQLDGSSGQVLGTDQLDFALATAFTAEAWVKADSFTGTSSEVGIIEKRGFDANGDQGWAFRIQGDGDVEFVVWRDDVYCRADSTAALTIGQATHVAGVFDNGTLRVYVNGGQAGSAASCPSPIDTPASFVLGYDSTDDYFDGVLDEVAVYDQALPPNRILAHVTAGQ